MTVAGIGPGSAGARTLEVSRAIEEADCVIGAARMLEAAGDAALRIAAIAPGDIAEAIRAHPECARFAVLMSGDTGFFSGAKKLLPLLEDCDVRLLPGLSSLSDLCARLCTDYESVVPVSLHGRERSIAGDVRRNARVFTLVGGENGMAGLCRRLTQAGLGDVLVSAGERLSYEDERITRGTARELAEGTFDSLCAALIENPHCGGTVTPGLPDEAFRRSLEPGHVVPMTKSEVRAVCLSKLRLRRGSVCWDVGAGTGSVSVEMALLADRGEVLAVEKNETALALLEENRRSFGTDNMKIIPGMAPEACEELPAPDRVFIGGSSGSLRGIIGLALSKNPHARIVATAISLESAAELTECMREFEASECVMLQCARSRAAGAYSLMQGQNPIWIFTMQNGENE